MFTSRPRLTIRTMMILIVLFAMALGGGVWIHRLNRLSAHYHRIAGEAARLEAVYDNAGYHWHNELRAIEGTAKLGLPYSALDREQYSRKLASAQKLGTMHARRRKVYERLAAFPWEAVPSDAEPMLSQVTPP